MWWRSLRFYIVLLVSLSLVPGGIYLVTTQFKMRQVAIDNAIEIQTVIKRSIASAQSRVIDSAITLITVLGRVPQIRSPDHTVCGALLTDILAESPRYSNLGVVDPSGQVVCSAVPLIKPVNVGDQLWFQRTMQTDAAVIGDYGFGPITGIPILPFSLALRDRDPNGRIEAVVALGLNLQWLGDLVRSVRLPEGSSLTLLDRAGTVLAQYPDGEKWVGRSIVDQPLFLDAVRYGTNTSFEALGLDNRKKLFTHFDLTSGAQGASVLAIIGIPIDVLIAGPNQLLARDLTASAAVIILLFLGCYLFATALISRPISQLAVLTRRIAGGDLAARSDLSPDSGEIGELASSMNSMAAALEQKETALIESESRIRAVMDNMVDGLITIDETGIVMSINPAALRMLGYAADEVIGQNVNILMPEPYQSAHDGYVANYLRTGKGKILGVGPREVPGLRKDGALLPLELAVAEVTLGGKRHFIGSIRDITERVRAEEARRASAARFRHLVESADVVAYTWDFDTRRLTYFGPQAMRFFGYPPEKLLSKGFWTSILHPDDRAGYLEWSGKVAAGDSGNAYECRVLAANGQVIWIRNVLARDTTSKDRRSTGYGYLFDITDAKLREQQLAQAQKMEAIGQLTGGFAHDFNNLLAVILGNLQLLARSLANDAQAQKRARTASDAAIRGADLTRQLLAFSRRQVLVPKVIDLNELLTGMTDMLHRVLGEPIEMKTALNADLWPARVDPAQLESAILNLAINARDAMPKGGRLTIEASNRTLSAEYAAGHAEVSAGPYVMLAVTDTGAGMSPEVLKHAFEPFFTTKEVGKGTGLGLSMVLGFLKQSGGHINIYSEEGYGTTVKLYLPRADAPRQSLADPAGLDKEQLTGKETILVVEDDRPVRETAVALLEELGYRVIQAVDVASALAELERDPKVDLLFTDVVMPGGMNGVALARTVAERWPHIKALYTSGYTENAIVHGGKLDEGLDWIGKPYFKDGLARMVRQVLDAPRKTPKEDKLS